MPKVYTKMIGFSYTYDEIWLFINNILQTDKYKHK